MHCLISIYLLYIGNNWSSSYWFLVIPVGCLFIETIITICWRKGVEYKYVWPSGFFYVTTIVPIIWIIELDLLQTRVNNRDQIQSTTLETDDSLETMGVLFLNAFKSSNEIGGKKVCELGLVICLILGRWLTPRGAMSREQLSGMLLGQVGNAADIIELFDTFDEPNVLYEKGVTISVLCVFTCAIYQFTLVTILTEEDSEAKNGFNNRLSNANNRNSKSSWKISHLDMTSKSRESYVGDIRTRKLSGSLLRKENRGKGRKITKGIKFRTSRQISGVDFHAGKMPNKTHTTQEVSSKRMSLQIQNITKLRNSVVPRVSTCRANIKPRKMNGEVFQILITILMQDGPFLIFRLYIITTYNVMSEMHIFFTCKNILIVILLIYRLLVLSCSGEDAEESTFREEAGTKLRNIQLAIMEDKQDVTRDESIISIKKI